jgi:hypothetical protein
MFLFLIEEVRSVVEGGGSRRSKSSRQRAAGKDGWHRRRVNKLNPQNAGRGAADAASGDKLKKREQFPQKEKIWPNRPGHKKKNPTAYRAHYMRGVIKNTKRPSLPKDPPKK